MELILAFILLLARPLALIAGIAPIFIWLWFWEHEDKHPEPKKLTALAFIAGMLAVCIVFFLEQDVIRFFPNVNLTDRTDLSAYIVIFLWAVIEEVVKFFAAYITVLKRRENDEPIDGLMYMIVVALGFAALENALFLLNHSNTASLIITGNFRFIGATLLHTISSGAIGIALALSFYKRKAIKRMAIASGVILAIVLHTLFNLTILFADGSNTIYSFYAVWLAIICLLLGFEKVKHITKPQQ